MLFSFIGAVMGDFLLPILKLEDVLKELMSLPKIEVNVILCVLGARIILKILEKIAPDAGRDIR